MNIISINKPYPSLSQNLSLFVTTFYNIPTEYIVLQDFPSIPFL